MKRNSGSRVAVLAFVLFIALVQTGCKENTLIDAKIDPNHNNGITASLFFPTITKSITDNTIATSSSFPGLPIYHGLGIINQSADLNFGAMYSGIYMQVIPLDPNINFTGYTIDSAFVVLPYGGFWGDTANSSATQNYTVYFSDSSLSVTNAYYAYTTVPLGSAISDPQTVKLSGSRGLTDSVMVDGVNQAPHMRLRLKSDFISQYIQTINASSATGATDNGTFLNWFKGIYIAPDTTGTGTAMPYLNLNDIYGYGTNYSRAGIVIYFRPNGTTRTADSTTSLYFNPTYCTHYNSIIRRLGAGSIAYGVLQGTTTNATIFQNQPGGVIDLKICNLKNLIVNGLIPVINNATLYIPIKGTGDPVFDSVFAPPIKVYPLGVYQNTDSTYQIADRYPLLSTSALAIMDGYPHVINGIKTYQLNIPREVQNALIKYSTNPSGGDTVHLRLIGTQDYLGAYQAVTGAGTVGNSSVIDTNYQIRLKVVYSKLK